MKLRLFLDEDVHFGLADALRKRGYDAVHTQEKKDWASRTTTNWNSSSAMNVVW